MLFLCNRFPNTVFSCSRVKWLYGSNFAIQDVKDPIAAINCPNHPIQTVQLKSRELLQVPIGCTATIDDFFMLGQSQQMFKAIEVESSLLAYNLSRALPQSFQHLKNDEIVRRNKLYAVCITLYRFLSTQTALHSWSCSPDGR